MSHIHDILLHTIALLCSVCSSEKIDKFARYSNFLISSMPYPGTYNLAMFIPHALSVSHF